MAIAVYGATGRTGRLVAEQLARNGDAVIVAGRNAGRLAGVAEGCAGKAEVGAADAADTAALRRLLAGAGAVVNCAPVGDAVLRAAVEARIPYLDANGDQAFIRRIFDDFGEAARRAGIALVPGAGFDYAPGDCIARLAAEGHEPLDELVVAYALQGSSTASDALDADSAGAEVVYRDGNWSAAPGGVQRASFRFPPPLGRRPMQRYGCGEVITVPRHTSTRKVTTLITAETWAPRPALAPLVPFLRPLAAALRRSPLRGALHVVRARLAPAGAETENEEASDRFTIAALARGADGSVGRTLAEGRDFHGLTAAALTTGASRLARGEPRDAGVLAPAAAFEPVEFLDALSDRLRWRRE